MLKEFIQEKKSCALQVQVSDWKEAVRTGVDLLVQSQVAEPRYYESILSMVQEYGPYFVIVPGVAMPHARPEMGALATGFSLVTLASPVAFGHQDNDPVDVVLCICAKDAQDMNETAIIEAMNLFDDEQYIQRLRAARTLEDVVVVLADAAQAAEE